MATITQEINDKFALYNGDSVEVMKGLPDKCIHLTVYSPPFPGHGGGLYNYSSDDRDMSNSKTYQACMDHYRFFVEQIQRITLPGRLSAVHCCDTPGKGGGLMDLPGDIIRLHESLGFKYHARFAIWKEPLRVAIRTRSKGLTHKQLVKDSSFSNNAGADYLLVFRNKGENTIPISHERGLNEYSGEREIPAGLVTKFQNWEDPQTNKLAHWIWQQYASSFWDDIRINRVLPYQAARDPDDEKHCHPLQLDVIDRCIQLWSNPGEKVLTPFMGVGSEVYGAVCAGRLGIGIELKPSYFRQALQNVKAALHERKIEGDLFGEITEEASEEVSENAVM